MTDSKREFKRVLTLYIEKEQKEADKHAKRGGTYAIGVIYGDKYLSEKNYINLKGLYNFAKRNTALTGKQIEEFIKQNANTFVFLNRFVTVLPDAVDTLRTRGCEVAAKAYKEQLKAEKVVESFNKNRK